MEKGIAASHGWRENSGVFKAMFWLRGPLAVCVGDQVLLGELLGSGVRPPTHSGACGTSFTRSGVS